MHEGAAAGGPGLAAAQRRLLLVSTPKTVRRTFARLSQGSSALRVLVERISICSTLTQDGACMCFLFQAVMVA